MDDMNASLNLEGLTLPSGWLVGQRRSPREDVGAFSVTYTVTGMAGRPGFLKVLDLVAVFGDLEALRSALNDYLAERDLLLMCGAAGMTRVVVALGHGQVTLEGYMPPLSTVHYIIFELADADLNRTLSDSDFTDITIRLDLLHDLAVGLRQLHARGIAHQDVKPSNALIFESSSGRKRAGKISDLGRAYEPSFSTSHDHILIPGDRSFAPPEQLYGYEFSDIAVRRYAADIYQLGSLICYTFGAVTMNGLMAERLAPVHHWDVFGDGYQEALPYLQAAYSEVIADLRRTLPAAIALEVAAIIEYLCEPDAERRGHPAARKNVGSSFALERVVADLNLASHRARSPKRTSR